MIYKEYNAEYYEDKPIWIVELSNGESIYQYDTEGKSSWLELKEYVYKNNLLIKKMYARFRSNIIYPLEENAEGYFFSIGIIGIMSCKNNMSYYLLGSLKNNNVKVHKIKIPEMITFEEEDRNISQCKAEQLIINKKDKNGKREIG
jgi:hypothetical protein